MLHNFWLKGAQTYVVYFRGSNLQSTYMKPIDNYQLAYL